MAKTEICTLSLQLFTVIEMAVPVVSGAKASHIQKFDLVASYVVRDLFSLHI